MRGVVAQSPEPGAQYKNVRLFTITLLRIITIFAKINSELKHKIFLRARLFTIMLLLTTTGSNIDRGPDCCAGGCRFKSRPDQHSGSLNN